MNIKRKTVALIAGSTLALAALVGGTSLAFAGADDDPTKVVVPLSESKVAERSVENVTEEVPVEVVETAAPTEPAPAPAPVAEPAPAPAPPPAPVAVLCPPGSVANSSDGFNDTSCFPEVCFTIAVPDPAHPECDVAFRP